MKALILEGKKTLSLQEIESPVASDSNKLITIEAAGIGGSEYLGFNNPGIRPLPNIMGHGFTGLTNDEKRVAVYPLSGCENCEYCAAGQGQLCEEWSLIGVQTNGGFAQYASIPNKQLIELPENISWEQSVFIEPFANSINAWEISNASEKESIAIIGAGSLGLGLIAMANKSGCEIIHISEVSTNRSNAAKALGATDIKLSKTYDIVFDTVGSVESRNQTIQSAKKGGKCIFLGFETPETNINMSEIIRHQKTLIGSFIYSKSQFQKAVSLAVNCNDAWVKNISFDEVEDVLNQFIQGHFEHVKVALRPNNESLS